MKRNSKQLTMLIVLFLILLYIPFFAFSSDNSYSAYENYSNCILPNLDLEDPFSEQAYRGYYYWEGLFFGNDGTFEMQTRFGGSSDFDYSFSQLEKTASGTYIYNSNEHLLTLKVTDVFAYGNFLNNLSDFSKHFISWESSQLAEIGYNHVIIPSKYIDYMAQSTLSNIGEKKLKCSVVNDSFILEANGLSEDKYDYGLFEYYKDDLYINFYITYNVLKITIKRGSTRLSTTLISSLEDGLYNFKGENWRIGKYNDDSKTGIIYEVGDFEGTCEYDYGNYYFKLTSVNGDISDDIKYLVGKEFMLTKISRGELEPVLKTINYTVIGSDGQKAFDAHSYVTNPSVTKWSENTLEELSFHYYEGIFSNAECTRSVMGKEIRNGTPVFVKLKEMTAAQYNKEFQNYVSNNEQYAKIEIIQEDNFNISFETNCDIAVDNQIVSFGDFVSSPDKLVRKGYVLENWYTDSSFEHPFSFSTRIAEDTKLYAKWIEQDLNVGGSGIGTKIGEFHNDVMYLPVGTNGTAGRNATYCYFGDFPQTIKPDGVTVDETHSITMGGFTYYEGSDGCYYLKCLESPFSSDYVYSDGTPIVFYEEVGSYNLESMSENGETMSLQDLKDLYDMMEMVLPEFGLTLNKDRTGKMVVMGETIEITWDAKAKTMTADGVSIKYTYKDKKITISEDSQTMVFVKIRQQATVDNIEGEYKYFRVEPIKWRVLTDNYNGTGKRLMLAENILSLSSFYDYSDIDRSIEGETVYPNNYEHSKIRAYLNGLSYRSKSSNMEPLTVCNLLLNDGFLQTAFTDCAQKKIALTNVDNSVESSNPDGNKVFWNNGINKYTCGNTKDKIFLLSVQEVSKDDYGFDAYNKFGNGNARIRIPSDYAIALGARLLGFRDYAGEYWFLRSPCYIQRKEVFQVANNGYAADELYFVYCNLGVVPALCLE